MQEQRYRTLSLPVVSASEDGFNQDNPLSRWILEVAHQTLLLPAELFQDHEKHQGMIPEALFHYHVLFGLGVSHNKVLLYLPISNPL